MERFTYNANIGEGEGATGEILERNRRLSSETLQSVEFLGYIYYVEILDIFDVWNNQTVGRVHGDADVVSLDDSKRLRLFVDPRI